MGLYKYKCNSHPIWSDVYHIEEDKLIVYTKLSELYNFYCDTTVTIPLAAVCAHDAHLQSKRWFEEGVHDEEGNMYDNRFITFNQARADGPSTDEPGKVYFKIIILSFLYLGFQ
jgi:hypothetical protein